MSAAPAALTIASPSIISVFPAPTDSSVAPECPKFMTLTPLPNNPCITDGYDLLLDDARYPPVMLSPTQATRVLTPTASP